MKKIFHFLTGIALLGGIYSCQETFLQKPDTSGTIDRDKIFSTALNAKAYLMNCYSNVLIHGWPSGWGVGHGALASISGERYYGYGWHGTYAIATTGLTTTGTDGSDAGADNYANNFATIRECYDVKQNIDKVPDLSADEKNAIKAECTGLIAYRYMGMFYEYGGLPLVKQYYDDLASSSIATKRATLQETLDFIVQLCDEAIAGLPAKWSDDQTGRLTKGAVMAVKARTLLFAARPLFNSATPYLSLGNNNNLICFGTADQERWKTAIDANEDVLTWAASNNYHLYNTGGAADGQPDPNAVDDYGKACSLSDNPEVILAYKSNGTNNAGYWCSYWMNISAYTAAGGNRWDTDQVGLLSNFLRNYWTKDGTDQSWPAVDSLGARPIRDWLTRAANMEPRFLVDNIFPGVGSKSNSGDNGWSTKGWGKKLGNFTDNAYSPANPSGGDPGKGCGQTAKFFYGAGSKAWFEPPLFRMAEIYLNLAEAYNEYNNTAKALENLNKVHNRAGLPAVTETDKGKLRAIIQREKAVEFYNENRRYYDVKHWKLDNIGNGIIGGQMRVFAFQVTSGGSDDDHNQSQNELSYWDSNAYLAYWSTKMFLEPFPQSEINKGFIVQNPGY